MRILWLFGPPGVGKSVTCWQLLGLLSDDGPTSYVDIDQLGMADPDPDDESETHRLKAWALAAVGRVHAERGTSTLVVSGVLDPDQVEFYRHALADFDLALVQLVADESELGRRLDARGEYAEDWSGVCWRTRGGTQQPGTASPSSGPTTPVPRSWHVGCGTRPSCSPTPPEPGLPSPCRRRPPMQGVPSWSPGLAWSASRRSPGRRS